jgi:predicted metal-dependent HD superfamily phosphohydrolase
MFDFVLQANRHYHNLAHLMCMFDFVKRASKAGVTLTDPAAVEWAVWFHDIVYQASSKSNEADSAELAGKCKHRSGQTPCLTKFECDE